MSGRHPTLALIALLLGGCGATTSTGSFEGEEKRVAEVVADLRSASESGDAAEICGRLLARELVNAVASGRSNCTDELETALEDADDYRLEVEDVKLAGTTATARVTDGDGRDRTLEFAKSGEEWKITGLGA